MFRWLYVASVRMAAGRWCRFEFRERSETLFRGFERVDANAQKRYRRRPEDIFRRAAAPCVVRVSSWTCPTRKAIKSHLLTEWIRRILRLIQHKVENYFPMASFVHTKRICKAIDTDTHSIWQKWNNVRTKSNIDNAVAAHIATTPDAYAKRMHAFIAPGRLITFHDNSDLRVEPRRWWRHAWRWWMNTTALRYASVECS